MTQHATTEAASTEAREFYTPAMTKQSAEVGRVERFIKGLDKTAQLY